MSQALANIPPSLLTNTPSEFKQLLFILAWLHSFIIERLRYIPTDISKFYAFNDSDFHNAINTTKDWIVLQSKGRLNINPTFIPWQSISSLLKDTLYGGKIDVQSDQLYINTLIDTFFCEKIFERDFELVAESVDCASVVFPVCEGERMDGYVKWVSMLPDNQPPQWLGLSSEADKSLQVSKGMFYCKGCLIFSAEGVEEYGNVQGCDV